MTERARDSAEVFAHHWANADEFDAALDAGDIRAVNITKLALCIESDNANGSHALEGFLMATNLSDPEIAQKILRGEIDILPDVRLERGRKSD